MENIIRCPDCGVTFEMLSLGTLHCWCDFFQKNDPFQEEDDEDDEDDNDFNHA